MKISKRFSDVLSWEQVHLLKVNSPTLSGRVLIEGFPKSVPLSFFILKQSSIKMGLRSDAKTWLAREESSIVY